MPLCLRCESADADGTSDFCIHCKSMKVLSYSRHGEAKRPQEDRAKREARLYGRLGPASPVRKIDPRSIEDLSLPHG